MQIDLNVKAECDFCDGTGLSKYHWEKGKSICHTCDGRGWYLTDLGKSIVEAVSELYVLTPKPEKEVLTPEVVRFKKRNKKIGIV
jgi:predicted methyltransferase